MPADIPAGLKSRITEDMKTAMRAGDKERLGTIRLILAAIKQVEVDTRTEMDDEKVLVVLDKMIKQRRESISQFENASREDLAAKERTEVAVIQHYMPEPLTDDAIATLIDEAMRESGATAVKDMGKVMNILRPLIQGRADMGAVSARVKQRLSA